jgi:hypothetical protein
LGWLGRDDTSAFKTEEYPLGICRFDHSVGDKRQSVADDHGGHSFSDILSAYPYVEEEDIRQALAYAAWRVEEIEVPLPVG